MGEYVFEDKTNDEGSASGSIVPEMLETNSSSAVLRGKTGTLWLQGLGRQLSHYLQFRASCVERRRAMYSSGG